MTSAHLVAARNLQLSLDATGRIVASTGVSRRAAPLSDQELAALRCFASPASAEEARARAPEAEVRARFGELVAALRARGLLVSPGEEGSGAAPTQEGFGSLVAHHVMLRDATRTLAYRAAIAAHVKDKVVLDVGCGSGVLSIFAAQAGARRVYSIEETAVSELARAMFAANGVEDRVRLLVGNSADLEPPEPVDVVVHELLGTDPFYENLLPTIEDVRKRWLKPGGRLLPQRLEVSCIALEAEFVPPISVRARLEASEFQGLYGVDFSPYLGVLSTIEELDELTTIPRRSAGFFDGAFLQPMLSEPARLRDIDLHGDLSAEADRVTEAPLLINAGGRLGALLITFRAHLDEQLVLTTSPYAPKSHWGWVIRDLPEVRVVQPGDRLGLRSSLYFAGGRQRIKVSVTS